MSSIYEANYFFRDFITEEIACIMIGECYLYFYKETLIGVRDQRANKGWFVNLDQLGDKNKHVPTLDKLNSSHVRACIDEMQAGDEEIAYLSLEEITSKAQTILIAELDHRIDRWLKGQP